MRQMLAGLHYLAGTTRKSSSEVLKVWKEYAGVEFEQVDRGGYGYKNTAVGVNGIRLYFTLGREDIFVLIPGEACELLGLLLVGAIFEALDLSVTRVDGAIDGAPFTPRTCYEAWKRGDVRTKAHKESMKFIEEPSGDTFYGGRRTSERYLRVYNRRGPTRVELELKGEWAKAFMKDLQAEGIEALCRLIMSYIRRFVDFVKSGEKENISECRLLQWWERFVGETEKCKVVVKGTVTPTLESLNSWIEKQVAPTLAMLVIAGGGEIDTIVGQVQKGVKRLGKRHRTILAHAGVSVA